MSFFKSMLEPWPDPAGSLTLVKAASNGIFNIICKTLLGDTLGCLIFSDFLEDEFSSENLHFLLAAYAFSKTQGQIEMRTKAELLINSYI